MINCPHIIPERDENYTLNMCLMHPEKIWGVTESDCEQCPICHDKKWQEWRRSPHKASGESNIPTH